MKHNFGIQDVQCLWDVLTMVVLGAAPLIGIIVNIFLLFNALCYRKCVCHPLTLICTFILVTMSLFSLVSVMVLLSYYADGELTHMDTQSITYGPGDTQSIFFSSLFCQQLSLDPNTLYSSDYEPSHLYLLNKDPTLTGITNITFEDRVVVSNEHNQRNFHFYTSSVIAFEVCASNDTYSGFASFYLIKGQKLYKKWAESQDESSTPQYVDYLQVGKICGHGEQTFMYEVGEEDQYYFVFVNDKHTDPQPAEIVVSYNIRRTVYEFNQSSVANSCSFTTSPCSVSVPFQHSTAALLVYGAPLNWEESWENMPMSVDCGMRVWLYSVMSAAGVLLIAVGTMCLCVSCCWCSRFVSTKEDEMNKPLLSQHTANLYDGKSSSKEMSDPSRDGNHRATPTDPHVAFRHVKSPHPPPSFKGGSGKFSLGSPTCETFTH